MASALLLQYFPSKYLSKKPSTPRNVQLHISSKTLRSTNSRACSESFCADEVSWSEDALRWFHNHGPKVQPYACDGWEANTGTKRKV
ncbi:hypothetical protein I7I50_03252 [Histoplasma capsulatum G186AR]|uniref:Uncharacterized protein n=1 Tax=Ajellomyces capsulatus TaxID=5037 RepID=A0A8H8D657_AJECA|nr:hypothetical protein I7I52_00079 [Histoplasma capsulatum]QSS72167.1 hypothetical protein I7I50_03252 [Histoplasma capsulatum G186AR]